MQLQVIDPLIMFTDNDLSKKNPFLIDTFSPWKHLRGGVYFVDTIPTTPSGKIARRLVKQMAIELYEKKN